MTTRRGLTAAEAAVFVSGVASIGLEILAGRVVAPEFGSSIYTWGSIIGVTLGALGLGYHVAGRRAPDRASRAALATVFLQAAVFVAFLLAAGEAVLRAADALPVPPRLAPVLPVTVLFGPPVLLLGYVSPYAAELSPEPTAGSASGRVYMLGTVGSLVGAFGTTFLLVPWLSVPVVELGFGLVLVAAAVALARPVAAGTLLRAGLLAVVLIAAFAVSGAGLAAAGTVVHEQDTAYQHLEVVDSGGVRTMYLDGAPQSATYTDGREGYVWSYARYFHLPLLLTENVDRVLFIGGGGFSGPKRYLAEYNVTVDVVELDPAVVRAARDHFGVPDSPRLHVHVGDGREFLEETDHEYDLILLDAYRKDRVPMHMTTVEFFELARSRLDSDGVLVANVISAASGPGSEFYRAEYRTMRAVFPHVYAFPTSDTPFLQNVELVATKGEGVSEAELVRRARARAERVGLNLTDEARRYRGPGAVPTDDVPVLRDDRAPVQRLLDPQLGRRYVVERANYSAPARMATPAEAPMRSAPAASSSRAVP
ncbi:MAG: spermidine synthase [Halobacteriaceae archaeon]